MADGSSARAWRALALLIAAPALVAILIAVAPITVDPVVLFGGLGYDYKASRLPGFSTIDPNQGYTAYALGVRAALDVVSGRLPLWNPYEGLGSPLLGEMQSAAFFPPTLLLLLPHGQLIEHACLQIVAGLGTYLFLRRFGLGVTAALAGGLLFEFNGVFAWFRNAIYNPIAFLPWLFYAVESLFAAVLAGERWRRRARLIALGALAAALALYAGFPEVVYFYCLPLFAWAALRTASLPWRRTRAFAGDVLLLGLLAFLLTSPLLLAFGHFLAEGNVGDHQNDGFRDAVFSPQALLTYLLPYLYGPLSSSENPVIQQAWSIGGYLGVMPCLLAIGGVLTGWRRPVVWLLAVWIVFAVAVSHGAPWLLDAFYRVPLVTVAAFARYMNSGWIFCAATLAAMFIDRQPALSSAARRQIGWFAAALIILLSAGALVLAWPMLIAAWQAHQGRRIYVVCSLLAASVLLTGAVVCFANERSDRTQARLTALAALEAILLFTIPFASAPARAETDRPLLQFLQEHLGLQRMAIAAGPGLSPNFGSAFGIATLNYDDLPVPARTVGYVQRELDPKVLPIMFRPDVSFRHETREQRRDDFLQRVPAYARAGVRYVLTNVELFSRGFDFRTGNAVPVALARGQSVTLSLAPRPGVTSIAEVTLLIGTYAGTSDGHLAAQICQDDRCEQTLADLARAGDNLPLSFTFASALSLRDAPFRLRFTRPDGNNAVALWSRPPAPDETAHTVDRPDMVDLLPQVTFADDLLTRPVLQTKTTAIYELPGVRPYATAPGCVIDAASRDRMVAECPQPARLTRLEVLMRGWTARVNGTATPVTLVEETFQGVDLPAGRSVVEFTYAPPGVRPAIWLAAATLIGIAAMASAALGRGGRGA